MFGLRFEASSEGKGRELWGAFSQLFCPGVFELFKRAQGRESGRRDSVRRGMCCLAMSAASCFVSHEKLSQSIISLDLKRLHHWCLRLFASNKSIESVPAAFQHRSRLHPRSS